MTILKLTLKGRFNSVGILTFSPYPLSLQRELTYTLYEFQEGIPVHFDLPESSSGTTVAVVDHNPSKVREHLGTWAFRHETAAYRLGGTYSPRFLNQDSPGIVRDIDWCGVWTQKFPGA